MGALGESVQGARGRQQVAAKILELLAGGSVQGHIAMQEVTLEAGAPALVPVRYRRGRAQPAHELARTGGGGDQLLDGGDGVAGQQGHLCGHRIGRAGVLLRQAPDRRSRRVTPAWICSRMVAISSSGGAGKGWKTGRAPGTGRWMTPSSTIEWKCTLAFTADPNRWMTVMAPPWASAMPSRAAPRRSPANTRRMKTAKHGGGQPGVRSELEGERGARAPFGGRARRG
jgi:hypothetical protein